MKYIDAERLRAEIEKRKKIEGWCAVGKDTADVYYARGFRFACDFALSTIDSLQQEQESVAERFARIIRGNLIGIDKDVQHKFEQLYFEVTGNKMYGGYND